MIKKDLYYCISILKQTPSKLWVMGSNPVGITTKNGLKNRRLNPITGSNQIQKDGKIYRPYFT